ncbi:substrate-binding domain-containing protein [Kineosporia rhizophila]|uniref:substrate-binding domain-containing protein n=1 Tax=Kineosporia TaxID=49184 RepID=UPI001E459E91|nr:substrate-binding domain-containing protein [Kineosporia sp. NBRC 101677]MCE0538928.1 substrate-binding domain-containing protein [Kineosporia rhizophila]GLY16211.1 LacI family transcriptional regulator [Kineosporia sp. NBRC 101677]
MGASTSIRRIAALGVPLSFAAVALAACGDSSSSGEAGGSGGDASPAKVAAIIKGLDNPFFQTMEDGIEAGAAAQGLETTVQAANSITDTTGQADKLTALAGQDFSCYIVNPITGTNLVQGLAQLAARDKTIVNIDSPVEEEAAEAAGATPATYIGTDNVEAGKLAGAEMTKLVSSGDVAVIGGTSGDVTSNARVEGFTQGLGSSVKVVQTVAADWNREKALTQATTVLRANPGLKGFYVANDDMALGVVRAVENAGKTGDVKVIGTDGVEEALTSVKDGGLTATVAQYPYTIGEMGLEACAAAAAGKSLPTSVDAPVELVTADVADKALAATPKPFGEYEDPIAELLK